MKDLFYKQLQIQDKEDNVFFWSDMHLGHACKSWPEPLYAKRGFRTLEEHDATLIKRWNETASFDAVVFNLGDMMFGYNGLERMMSCFEMLNFKTMYLMFGNHIAGTHQVFESVENNVLEVNSEKQVIFCPNYLEININGHICILSHYPIASYNKQNKGAYMIHGHCHGNLYPTDVGKILYQYRIIDVGVERFERPVSFNQIKHTLKNNKDNFDRHP
jgi:calcineurin-like phosphoesterase family protein